MVEDDTIRIRAQHPGGEALLDAIEGLRRERLQEPGFATRRDDGDGLEQVPRLGAQTRRPGEDRGDLLSTLLLARDEQGSGMSERQVRDEVMTLFLAGHETTAVALSWTWYLLAQHPEVDARLADEPVPVPGPGEALVRVKAVGICGSDLHWFGESAIGGVSLSQPLVLGHEAAGVIASGPRAGACECARR